MDSDTIVILTTACHTLTRVPGEDLQ